MVITGQGVDLRWADCRYGHADRRPDPNAPKHKGITYAALICISRAPFALTEMTGRALAIDEGRAPRQHHWRRIGLVVASTT